MPDVRNRIKRIVIGRPVQSTQVGDTLLPKRLALPVFASDALSSVAYAPDEVFLTLAIAGAGALVYAPWIGAAVAIVVAVVVASYRQSVYAYPGGGGDYQVASQNLGENAGLSVAAALMCDYMLTVAVSISSGAGYAAAAIPALKGHEIAFSIVIVLLLTVLHLRGLRESGKIFALPVYGFMGAIGVMMGTGLIQYVTGNLPAAPSAGFTMIAEPGFDEGLAGAAGVMLLLRAFSSGSAALTGIEAVSNGVPAFRKPKSKNAATTLLLLGVISIVMLLSITLLARASGVQFAENPAKQLLDHGVPVGGAYQQDPVISQIAKAVFAGFPPMFYFTSIVTGLILAFAANTAFSGFPVLGSVLAKDGFMPRQLHTRGDRLAYSNGIVILSVAAMTLIVIYRANVTHLIQLYIVGVFISFTLGQIGLIRHWNGALRTASDPMARRRMIRSRTINTVGACLTGLVLVIVIVSKLTHGAWVTLTMMAVLFVVMKAIKRHYNSVAAELALDPEDQSSIRALPSRVHAIVLVSKLHQPAMRAIAYARATRPSTLEVLTVAIDPEDAERIREDWERLDIPVTLKILDSPYREITRPIVEYVRSMRVNSPRDLVVVYVPEYVVGHWWEQILHNQSALRLKSRLLFTKGVVVASVPWQLDSSAARRPDSTKRRPQ